MGYWTRDEANRAAAGVGARDELTGALLAFAEKLIGQKRDLAAAFDYRAAEFFTHPLNHERILLYDQFHDHFYAAVQDKQPERYSLPYQDGSLPALRLSPEDNRGTILIVGGLDSFMEEFYSIACGLAGQDFEVILFDGPGQGAAVLKSDLYMTHEWERPVRRIT